MAAKNNEKILEEFMRLASKEIGVIAKRVQFEPAARAAVAELFKGLSAAAQKSISDFVQTTQTLSKKDRDALSSGLEKSGVVNAANLLIPLLRMGDATDPCFLAHESAKVLHSSATIVDINAGMLEPLPIADTIHILAEILEGMALAFDMAAQFCDQSAAELAEENLNLMEAAVKRLEEKIDFIMDLPPGVDVPPVPKNETPTSLTTLRKLLEVAKKFYKFEGSFTPTFSKDKQLIRIGPLASAPVAVPPIPILVTGFIDLGGMLDYDVVTITTKVLEPSPSPHYVIWRVTTFTGHQSSGMKHFQDFADLLEVPGDGVEVLIAQSASSHNFDPAFLLTIPYQFLVETTVLPDFSVS
jgi:hypothetical protein